MPYRIDFDSPLADEVDRIASELLSGAVDFLERQPDGHHKAIHDARRNIKRTRALYRLIASDARDFAAAENVRLRDIARQLSHLRDSAALAEAVEYLERETIDEADLGALHQLGRAMQERRDAIAGEKGDIRETLATCAAGLRDAQQALRKLDLPRLRKQAIECIARGWRKIGRKAEKAATACRQTDNEEAFHDLRKRGQDRWMHAALLHALWPAGMTSIQRQAKAMVSLLGHERDVALLGRLIAQDRTGLDEQQHARLQALIAAERQKLQAASREAALDIFDDHPKRDAEIIAMLIRNRR